MLRYYQFFKPFQVLAQFTSDGGKKCLKDFLDVPVDVYPLGRLDYDSEGLLLLTNDKTVNLALLHPDFKHSRTYLVQVEGIPNQTVLDKLTNGVQFSVNGKPVTSLPCTVSLLDEPPSIPERNPPIRFRANIPTSWLLLELTEGKNRQVRKMTAAAGCPTLRLIRFQIEELSIENMLPGDFKELTRAEFYGALSLAQQTDGAKKSTKK